jgi:ABC-2 type transport system ATP-binding protein
MKHLLETRNVCKRFGRRTVLSDVNLALPRGSITALLGPNGAGKSTFLRLAMGLLLPDGGVVRTLGQDPTRGDAVRRSVGFVPDEPDAYDWMTPLEFFGFLEPQYPTWHPPRVAAMIERLRIPIDTRFADLSRGAKVKCMLVAAMAHGPALLLLDEPFAGLDPLAREEILGAFLETLPLGGTTALISTHDLDVAARIADRVALLVEGRLETCGTLEEILEKHGEPGQVTGALRGLFGDPGDTRIPA